MSRLQWWSVTYGHTFLPIYWKWGLLWFLEQQQGHGSYPRSSSPRSLLVESHWIHKMTNGSVIVSKNRWLKVFIYNLSVGWYGIKKMFFPTCRRAASPFVWRTGDFYISVWRCVQWLLADLLNLADSCILGKTEASAKQLLVTECAYYVFGHSVHLMFMFWICAVPGIPLILQIKGRGLT